jgi:trimeric autotransporter adhesin
MKANQILRWLVAVSLFYASPMLGQQRKPVSERSDQIVRVVQATEPEAPTTTNLPAQENQATTPRVLKFSGVLMDLAGKPLSGPTEVTFKLYKQEADEDALWAETQTLEVDKEGRYTVLLGATQSEGIPVELFSAAEAHWLGVEIQGQPQQPRTLLVSVPYALKAVEAEKLAGKSVSDFVLSESLSDQVRQVIEGQTIIANQATSTGTVQQGQPKANFTASPQATPAGAGPMFPPSSFSGTNSTQIVQVTQNGSGNGLYAQTASSTGNSGVVGVAVSTSTSNNQNGVIGFNAGAGAGVAGIATNPSAGVGVYGQSATGFAGVIGNSLANSGFGAGVFGTTASPVAAGVNGVNNSANGSGTGVSGFTASTNGAGVFGNASATSGPANGVFGQAASPDGSGVHGGNTAASGFATGVSGYSVSTGGNGVFGEAAATSGFVSGVFGQTSSTSGNGVLGLAFASSGSATGVNGQSSSPTGNGVIGIATATSGSPNGVVGEISSPNGAGVLGVANATTGFNNGVFAATFSNEGAGVSGNAVSTSGNPVGVVGTSAGANGGIGAWGIFQATSGSGVGVRGDLEEPTASGAAGLFLTVSPTSVAGQFANFSRQGLILQGLSGPFDATQKEVFSVDSSGNLHITGNLTVDGMKSSTAKLQDGREVALYAVESPENWFEDFGSGELQNGVAWVPLEASFSQAVNATVNYHVFLTPNGDSNGLYVARKTAAGFEIREHGGGTSNVAFDYRIVARRRGYEAIRMLQVPERKTPETFTRHVELATARPKVEPVKIPPSVSAPMIHPVPPTRPNIPPVPKINVPQTPKTR